MEACGSAHYWARELNAMGHEVVLMPPVYTKPYVKRGKNDAADAAACCEAMSRPGMRFVPVKSADQQAVLMLHKSRELLVKQRTMCVNALRGHLSEFGLIAAKGIGHIDELLELARGDARLPAAAQGAVEIFAGQVKGLHAPINDLESQIRRGNKGNPLCGLLLEIPGVRKLLVLGATPLLRIAAKRTGPLHGWIVALLARKPERVVTVALANKLARIIWAMLQTGERFRTELFARAPAPPKAKPAPSRRPVMQELAMQAAA